MKRRILLGIASMFLLCAALALAGAQQDQQQKVKTRSTQKGWLGVSIQDITPEMKRAMDLQSRDGALVSEVVRKSPADSAGIKEKDVIVKFGDQSIDESSDLQKAVADTRPGTKVAVVVVRKGERKTIDVVVGKQASRNVFAFSAPGNNRVFEVLGAAGKVQGMSLRQLNDQLAKYFDVPAGSGVLVWEVEKGSPADKAGIAAGDVITVVGKKKIKELRDVSRALGIYDDGEKADLELVRKGTHKTLSMEIEDSRDDTGYQFWYNDSGAPRPFEGRFFESPDINIQIPKMNLDKIRPDMDQLRIEMDQLRSRMQDQSIQLRDNIRKMVRPEVKVRVEESI